MSWYNLPKDTKIEIYKQLFINIPTIEQINYIIPNYITNKDSLDIFQKIYKIIIKNKSTYKEYQKLLIYESEENIIKDTIWYDEINHTIIKDIDLYKGSFNNEKQIYEICFNNDPNLKIWNQCFILIEFDMLYYSHEKPLFTQRLFYKEDSIWTIRDLYIEIDKFYKSITISTEQAYIIYSRDMEFRIYSQEQLVTVFSAISVLYMLTRGEKLKQLERRIFYKNNKEYIIFRPSFNNTSIIN